MSGTGQGGRRGFGGFGLVLKLGGQASGKAEAAGLGNAVGQLGGDEIAIDAIGGGVADELRFENGFLAFLEDLAEEDGFESAADFADFVLLADLRARGDAVQRQVRQVDLV